MISRLIQATVFVAISAGTIGVGSAQGVGNSAQAAAPVPSHTWRMPEVMVTQNGLAQKLPLEKAQLAETKTKPSSMTTLAGDSMVSQAMSYGVNTAAEETAMHMSSSLGGSAVMESGSVFTSIMSRRKPTVTYVWGVPSVASANVLKTAMPVFSLDFSVAPGVNPDDYEPAMVKLTPAQNTCRLVGATEGKENAKSNPAADWQMYSHFLEERVPVKAQKLGPGRYTMSPASELFPGEYGVVLRPVSRTKNFSGGDVARAQGDGLVFDAIWTFQVPESLQ